MSDHGGIRNIVPVHAAPGAPVMLRVCHADGHCEDFHATDEKLFHFVAELVVMLRSNFQVKNR